jgi:hypothetical protein
VFVQLHGEWTPCQQPVPTTTGGSQDLPRKAPPRPTLGNYIHFPEARAGASAISQVHWWAPSQQSVIWKGPWIQILGACLFATCWLMMIGAADQTLSSREQPNDKLHWTWDRIFHVPAISALRGQTTLWLCLEIRFWDIFHALMKHMKFNIWCGERFSPTSISQRDLRWPFPLQDSSGCTSETVPPSTSNMAPHEWSSHVPKWISFVG